jgi:hypothetical protein
MANAATTATARTARSVATVRSRSPRTRRESGAETYEVAIARKTNAPTDFFREISMPAPRARGVSDSRLRHEEMRNVLANCSATWTFLPLGMSLTTERRA